MPLPINLFSQPSPRLISSAMNAPVLTTATDIGEIDLYWDWLGDDPDHWNVERSDDGGATWVIETTEAGDSRISIVSAASLYRITGMDAADGPVTGTSNAVQTTI